MSQQTEPQKIDYMHLLALTIQEAKKQMYLPEYQDRTSDLEVLGGLVSKFSKWDLENIKEVVRESLEDSNFHDLEVLTL